MTEEMYTAFKGRIKELYFRPGYYPAYSELMSKLKDYYIKDRVYDRQVRPSKKAIRRS